MKLKKVDIHKLFGDAAALHLTDLAGKDIGRFLDGELPGMVSVGCYNCSFFHCDNGRYGKCRFKPPGVKGWPETNYRDGCSKHIKVVEVTRDRVELYLSIRRNFKTPTEDKAWFDKTKAKVAKMNAENAAKQAAGV